MTQFSLSSVAYPTAAQVAVFKEFAAVNAGSEALLAEMLTRAMLAVQEWEDRSLLAATVTLTVTDREDTAAPVHLYLTPSEVTSVSNADGEALAYSLVGKELIPSYRTAAVTVVYKTAPEDGDLLALMPKVYRYATALYDGESSSTLARILQER